MSAKSVSVLKETRNGEKRVILLPKEVGEFSKAGYQVFVETGAGQLSGYSDETYRDVGAEIVNGKDAWHASDVVLKYKAPGPEEYCFFRPELHLACFMHAEGNLGMTEKMRASGMSGYALEFFETPSGTFPVPVSDNEISGKLAIQLAAYHLQSHMGGNGVLLSGAPGAPTPKVVVIGYGNAGGAAARLAAAMGADVTVFGTRWEGLRQFQASVPGNVNCQINTPEAFRSAILEADVVVGAILISTHDTPVMLSEDLVKQMKPGSVIVDVTCGYGSGYMPSFDKLTTYDAPFYERHGVLHCKIDAMPASVPRTAAHATSYNVWRNLLAFADGIYSDDEDPTARAGCVVRDYEFIHSEVLRHIELENR